MESYKDYDFNPSPGINYYRLKQVDKGGKYSYSHIVAISFNNNDFIQLYPNPTKDYLVIKNNFPDGSEWKVTLTDILGRELFEKYALSNEEKISIEKFTEGTYYCKIVCKDTGFEKTFKVVKW